MVRLHLAAIAQIRAELITPTIQHGMEGGAAMQSLDCRCMMLQLILQV
jgi:hypothetical protein